MREGAYYKRTRGKRNIEQKGSDKNEGGLGVVLHQALAGHLYRVPDNLFGLVPQSAEKARVPLISANSQPPPNLIHNTFVTTSGELSTY